MKIIFLEKKSKIVKQIINLERIEEKYFWINQFSYLDFYLGSEDISNISYQHKLLDDKFVLDEDLVNIQKQKELEQQELQQQDFFESERKIALRINEDSSLELIEASENDLLEIKQYLKSINPNVDFMTFNLTTRPKIMNDLYPLENL